MNNLSRSMRKKFCCTCGLQIAKAQQATHRRGVWHRYHRRIQNMLEAGETYILIANSVGTTPNYISMCVARTKK